MKMKHYPSRCSVYLKQWSLFVVMCIPKKDTRSKNKMVEVKIFPLTITSKNHKVTCTPVSEIYTSGCNGAGSQRDDFFPG